MKNVVTQNIKANEVHLDVTEDLNDAFIDISKLTAKSSLFKIINKSEFIIAFKVCGESLKTTNYKVITPTFGFIAPQT